MDFVNPKALGAHLEELPAQSLKLHLNEYKIDFCNRPGWLEMLKILKWINGPL